MHSTLLRFPTETEPARAGLQTVRIHVRCRHLLAVLGGSHCSLRDTFLIALVKAALPPRVVAVLDEPQQASSTLPSSVPLEGQPPESDERHQTTVILFSTLPTPRPSLPCHWMLRLVYVLSSYDLQGAMVVRDPL